MSAIRVQRWLRTRDRKGLATTKNQSALYLTLPRLLFVQRTPNAILGAFSRQALLGDTLEAIAEQKAGIIKKDSVVFCCASMPVGVLDTIARTAKLQNASLTLVQPANLDASGGGEAPSLTWALPDNVVLATAALMHAGLALTGMERVFWPCRLGTGVYLFADWLPSFPIFFLR